MPTLREVASVLAAHPGQLPAPARALLVDAAIQPGEDARLHARILRRADLTLAEARTVRQAIPNSAPTWVQAAWLARPEHDLTALPGLITEEADGRASIGNWAAYIVDALLREPLCRPEVLPLLADCDDARVTAAAAAARVTPDEVRDAALLRTDELLSPTADTPPNLSRNDVVETLDGLFTAAATTDPARLVAWCRQLRAAPLILAAAAALPAPDGETTRYAVRSGVLPALPYDLQQWAADDIHTIITRGFEHLDTATRLEVAQAILDSPNAERWPRLNELATALSEPVWTTVAVGDLAYGDDLESGRAAAAAHLVDALGDNVDAWRVLRASLTHATDATATADLATLCAAVARPAAR